VKRFYRKNPTIVLETAVPEDFQDSSLEFVEGESYVIRIGNQPLGISTRDHIRLFPEFENLGIYDLIREMIHEL